MNKKLLEKFVESLVESGLPQERQRFWVTRMESKDFAENEMRMFMKELTDHLENLDDAIAQTTADLVSQQQELKQAKVELLPVLEKLAQEQPAFAEQELKNYKSEIHKAEKEMVAALKAVRATANVEDIEAIRRKLAGG